jgi:hypothetical protein
MTPQCQFEEIQSCLDGIIHVDCSSLLIFLTDQMEIDNGRLLTTTRKLNTGPCRWQAYANSKLITLEVLISKPNPSYPSIES